jgi:hypothetical protein
MTVKLYRAGGTWIGPELGNSDHPVLKKVVVISLGMSLYIQRTWDLAKFRIVL